MPNSAPILSNPAVLSALAKHWHNQNDEPSITHAGTGRYLSPAQFMSLLLAARSDPYRGSAALLSCCLLTGIAPADLRLACWADVDLESGTLIALSDVTGNFECHTLTRPACLFLQSWWNSSISHTGQIFELFGECIEMDTLVDTLAVLGEVAGIKNLAFDDLLCSHEYIALVAALTDDPAGLPVEVPAMSRHLDHC